MGGRAKEAMSGSHDGGEEPFETVKLHVYDVSQGMALKFSKPLLGKHIPGIWHTGIVAYGKEFYFGAGITADSPGCTPFGEPFDVLTIGTTNVPLQLLNRFLDELQEKYTADTYHLLDNNCNNFTADLAFFLTGHSIPDAISALPTIVLESPLGKLIRPLIDNMERLLRGSTNPATSPNTANTGSVLLVNSLQKATFPLAELAAVTMKLYAFDSKMSSPQALNEAERATLDELVSALNQGTDGADEGVILREGMHVLDAMVDRWPEECLYPAVDLLRVLVGRSTSVCTQHCCTKKNTLFKLLQILTDENRVVRPALDLMTVRLLANLCGVPEGRDTVLSDAHLGSVVKVVLDNLLQLDIAMVEAAASVIFNCAPCLTTIGQQHVVQLTAGLMHAIPLNDDCSCVFRLLMALGVVMWHHKLARSLVRLKSDFSVNTLIRHEKKK